jgi:hypothetical protein
LTLEIPALSRFWTKIRIGKWESAILTELLLQKWFMDFNPKNPGTGRYFTTPLPSMDYKLTTM